MPVGSPVSAASPDDDAPRPHAEAIERLARVAQRTPCPAGVLAALQQPARLVAVQAGGFTAWRARQSLEQPGLGPFAVDPELTADDVRAAALRAHLQYALLGLPHAGAAGGLAAPRGTDLGACVEALRHDLGHERDVIGRGPGVDARAIDAWAHTHRRLVGRIERGAVVGRSAARAGISARDGAVGRGAMLVLLRFLRQTGLEPRAQRVAIHGFGPVGRATASYLQRAGLRVVAICERRGGVLAEGGLATDALAARLDAARLSDPEATLASVSDHIPLSPEGVLAHDADVLVLASASGVFGLDQLGLTRARTIIEVSGGAIRADADAALVERRVAVLPDLVAGAGGPIMDHLCWHRARFAPDWDDEALGNRLAGHLDRAWRALWSVAVGEGRSARAAALALALRRLTHRAEG